MDVPLRVGTPRKEPPYLARQPANKDGGGSGPALILW
jgi:hypothetical protein